MHASGKTAATPTATRSPEVLPPHAPLTQFYQSPDERPGFVKDLFDHAAGSYDEVSRLIAFGSDRRYRREALLRAGLRPGLHLLDIATGTGLVLDAAMALGLPARDLVGLDPSRGMLDENPKQHRVALIQGLGERLPFAAEKFDFVTMGYALRHVTDLRSFFAEVRRVLKPGGRVLILEITRPKSWLGARLMRFHLLHVVPWLARRRPARRDAAPLMAYYWATIEQCVPPETILAALASVGFADIRRQSQGGILSDYLAVKR